MVKDGNYIMRMIIYQCSAHVALFNCFKKRMEIYLLVLNKIENDLHELCINEQCNLRIISNPNFRSIAFDIMPEMGAARNCYRGVSGKG